MNDLKLYFVMFSIHKENEWVASAGYVISDSEEDLKYLLDQKYGEVSIRFVNPVDIKKGTVLYGERWSEL